MACWHGPHGGEPSGRWVGYRRWGDGVCGLTGRRRAGRGGRASAQEKVVGLERQ